MGRTSFGVPALHGHSHGERRRRRRGHADLCGHRGGRSSPKKALRPPPGGGGIPPLPRRARCLRPPCRRCQTYTVTRTDVQSYRVGTVAGAEPRLVLRIVLPSGEEDKDHDETLPTEVLDNLRKLFKRLPDGHYRIYQIQPDGVERLVVDVIVRQGRSIDAADEAEGAADLLPQPAPPDRAARAARRRRPAVAETTGRRRNDPPRRFPENRSRRRALVRGRAGVGRLCCHFGAGAASREEGAGRAFTGRAPVDQGSSIASCDRGSADVDLSCLQNRVGRPSFARRHLSAMRTFARARRNLAGRARCADFGHAPAPEKRSPRGRTTGHCGHAGSASAMQPIPLPPEPWRTGKQGDTAATMPLPGPLQPGSARPPGHAEGSPAGQGDTAATVAFTGPVEPGEAKVRSISVARASSRPRTWS